MSWPFGIFVYIGFRLATEAAKKRNVVAKDILEQINDLLEDLGPVEPVKDTETGEDDEWEDETMEQDWFFFQNHAIFQI